MYWKIMVNLKFLSYNNVLYKICSETTNATCFFSSTYMNNRRKKLITNLVPSKHCHRVFPLCHIRCRWGQWKQKQLTETCLTPVDRTVQRTKKVNNFLLITHWKVARNSSNSCSNFSKSCSKFLKELLKISWVVNQLITQNVSNKVTSSPKVKYEPRSPEEDFQRWFVQSLEIFYNQNCR